MCHYKSRFKIERDSQGAITMVKDTIYNANIEHIDMKYCGEVEKVNQ